VIGILEHIFSFIETFNIHSDLIHLWGPPHSASSSQHQHLTAAACLHTILTSDLYNCRTVVFAEYDFRFRFEIELFTFDLITLASDAVNE
jgi:hypothetical protein